MGSYIPAAPAEQREMLEAIGLRDFRELYRMYRSPCTWIALWTFPPA